MADIYKQHQSAFSNVAAHAVLKDGKLAAKIAFKFGNAVTAYVHFLGIEMVRGQPGGGGYDRQSAACAYAAEKLAKVDISGSYADGTPHHDVAAVTAFVEALRKDDGYGWDHHLKAAGFDVRQVV